MPSTNQANATFERFKRLRFVDRGLFRNFLIKVGPFVAVSACMVFFAVNTELLEVDEVIHYSLSRSVPSNIKFLVNPWGKPLFSFLSFLAIVASNDAGLISIRLMNVLFSIMTCFVTYKLCRKLRFSEFWAFSSVFTVAFSHVFFKISFSALTEPLFSLVVVLAIYFFYSERYDFSALFISLSCIARQEGLVLLPVWWLFLPKHKRTLVLTMLFPFLWSLLLWFNACSPFHMVTMYSDVINPLVQTEGENIAGQGLNSFLYYPLSLIAILGPVILLLFLVGFICSLGNKKYTLLYTVITVYVFFHSIILVFPYFGSVGFLRYLYPVIPSMAVFSTFGLRTLVTLFSRIKQSRIVGRFNDFQTVLASIIVLILSLNCLFAVTPKTENETIINMAPPLYSALQHDVGDFLLDNYPENVGVFCPTNLFILQLYLSMPDLYFPKENPSEENYTIMKLDGRFQLSSFDIYEDCPPGHLVVWTNDLMFVGSKFHPHKVDNTRYKTQIKISKAMHTIIVYERI